MANPTNRAWPPLPDHIETAVRDSASLHAEHESSASPLERWTIHITGIFGRPATIVGFSASIALWLGGNLVLTHLGAAALDTPTFAWLQLVLAIAAVLMTVVILGSQRRSQILAIRREQLMLQLAFSSDHKVAKIIALLEELRHDDPLIADRPDRQAVAMASTSDPQKVVDAIEEAHDELVEAAKDAAGR